MALGHPRHPIPSAVHSEITRESKANAECRMQNLEWRRRSVLRWRAVAFDSLLSFVILPLSFVIFRLRGCLTVAAILAILFAGPASALELPRLVVEGPEETAREITAINSADPRRLAVIMKLVGLEEAGEPILVIVAPESSPLAQRTPKFIQGYAVSEENLIVLFPGRTNSYPIDGLEELLRHEIAHVLIARAAGGREVPRWFHEGVATVAGEAWSVPDRGRLTVEMLTGGRISFTQINRLFYEGQDSAARAYAFSGAFVHDLLQREGGEVVADILAALQRGVPFEKAFYLSTGMTLLDAETEFWQRRNLWNRWVPFLSSSAVLWAAITLLGVYAMQRRRKRDRLVMAGWDEELAVEEPEEEIIN